MVTFKWLTLENKLDMNKGTKRLLASLALTAGTLSTAFLLRKKRKGGEATSDRWARPGMQVTFRAELMPGRDRMERTYRVTAVLPSDRVLLDGVAGEHTRGEFEPVR